MNTTKIERDSIVCEEYAKIPEAADEIVADSNLSNVLRKKVNARLPKSEQFDETSFNKRLINLRRKGEENGGLIRKFRRFNGRKPK